MANGIKIGNNDITLKLGSADVSAAYIGDTLVYSGGTPPTFQGKWIATYTGGTTSSAECDSSSAITQNEITNTDLEVVELGDCVTSIGNSAFYNCRSLTSVTIPNSVTSIGQGAFHSCSGLTSIVIPSGVTSIGRSAFNGCRSLTSIDIPSGVTSIGNSAFYNCRSLTSIDIPSGVTSIGNEAFYNCSGLTSCTIGNGVTTIGYNAFQGCSSLTGITIYATTPPTLGGSAFDNTNNCPILVPPQSFMDYQSNMYWMPYSPRLQPIQ